MKELMEVLRLQRHDFLNHLQVVSGYLQLKKHDRAMDYIRDVSQDMMRHSQVTRVENPLLAVKLLILQHNAFKYGVDLDLKIMTVVAASTVDQVIIELIHTMEHSLLKACGDHEINSCQMIIGYEEPAVYCKLAIDRGLSEKIQAMVVAMEALVKDSGGIIEINSIDNETLAQLVLTIPVRD